MTYPPATCELCGDTGLYSPSALPCPKGCSAEDIVDRLRAHDLDLVPDWRDDADMHSWMDTADALMSESAEYITNLRQALSEAEEREKDARGKALEDAAKVAESWKAMPCDPQRHLGHRDAAYAISAAIRTLKDEVR